MTSSWQSGGPKPQGNWKATRLADVVLDASAVLAVLNEEPGSDEVSAHLPAGDVPTNLFETDFVSPETAEYHLVIHDHGPLIPEIAADMLSSYRGGCTLESVPPHYPESARTDGEGGPNTCVSRQVALFVPERLSN